MNLHYKIYVESTNCQRSRLLNMALRLANNPIGHSERQELLTLAPAILDAPVPLVALKARVYVYQYACVIAPVDGSQSHDAVVLERAADVPALGNATAWAHGSCRPGFVLVLGAAHGVDAADVPDFELVVVDCGCDCWDDSAEG
jgi:hypothetical protein